MMTTFFLIAALSIAPPAAGTSEPQPARARPAEAQEDVPIPAEEVEIAYYRPKWMSAQELINAASELIPTTILVRTSEVPGTRPLVNTLNALQRYGDVVRVRGTRQQVDAFLAVLRKVEESLEPPPDQATREKRDPELVDFDYQPRFVDPRTLELALERFRGPLRLQLANGGFVSVPNITVLPEHGLILVKETPERVAEIQTFLERLDTPAPQVTISYLVLQGGSQADPSTPALPAALTDNLRKLVPFQHFHLQSSGVLRGSSRASMQVQSEQVDAALSLRLELEPASFDAASRTLTMRRCRFELLSGEGRRMLETGAALRVGEYTVIGAAGRDALFLVLRLTLD